MRFGIVIPLWQRPELTRHCLVRIRNAVEGGPHTSLFWFSASPDKLGMKFNKGYQALKGQVDAIIRFDSDVWISDGFLNQYARWMRDHQYVGLLDHYYLDGDTGAAIHWHGYHGSRKGEPAGDGRCLRADLLDKLDWAPHDPNATDTPDLSMTQKLHGLEVARATKTVAELNGMICSFKTENINSFAVMESQPTSTPTDPEWVLSHFPKDEVANVKKTLWKT